MGKNIALINCPECTHIISDQSLTCPSCGFPLVKSAPFKDTSISSSELKELKLLKELEEVGEHEEYGFFNNTNMFIIACIIIYFIAKEDIHYILQYVMDSFSK